MRTGRPKASLKLNEGRETRIGIARSPISLGTGAGAPARHRVGLRRGTRQPRGGA